MAVRPSGGDRPPMSFSAARDFLKSLEPAERTALRALRRSVRLPELAAQRMASRRQGFLRWLVEHGQLKPGQD